VRGDDSMGFWLASIIQNIVSTTKRFWNLSGWCGFRTEVCIWNGNSLVCSFILRGIARAEEVSVENSHVDSVAELESKRIY